VVSCFVRTEYFDCYNGFHLKKALCISFLPLELQFLGPKNTTIRTVYLNPVSFPTQKYISPKNRNLKACIEHFVHLLRFSWIMLYAAMKVKQSGINIYQCLSSAQPAVQMRVDAVWKDCA